MCSMRLFNLLMNLVLRLIWCGFTSHFLGLHKPQRWSAFIKFGEKFQPKNITNLMVISIGHCSKDVFNKTKIRKSSSVRWEAKITPKRSFDWENDKNFYCFYMCIHRRMMNPFKTVIIVNLKTQWMIKYSIVCVQWRSSGSWTWFCWLIAKFFRINKKRTNCNWMFNLIAFRLKFNIPWKTVRYLIEKCRTKRGTKKVHVKEQENKRYTE